MKCIFETHFGIKWLIKENSTSTFHIFDWPWLYNQQNISILFDLWNTSNTY